MEKMLGVKFSRQAWSSVLAAAAVFSLAGAWLFDAVGFSSQSLTPLNFVFSIILACIGAYLFLPVLKDHGPQASTIIKDVILETRRTLARYRLTETKKNMSLWDEHDPRVDMGLFSANVPTFVLNNEQRFLDWNVAFDLIFGHSATIKKGGHISAWFEHLDNFKRVAVRSQKLYGEGILPISDRERATYLSKEFGRMVFTKIMSPIIDRQTGRIVGWNVVLNINSVNKRELFLEKLYAAIELETKRIRYASAYDSLFGSYSAYKKVVDSHLDTHKDAERLLEVGCGTGAVTCKGAARGIKVTAIDGDVHMLRKLRDKKDINALPVRIIKQHPEDMKKVPENRYDGAVMMLNAHKYQDITTVFRSIFNSLKPGALLSVSALDAQNGLDGMYNGLRTSLEVNGRYEKLKHQFNQVVDFDQELFRRNAYRHISREDLRALMLEAGFSIADEKSGMLGGCALMVVGRK